MKKLRKNICFIVLSLLLTVSTLLSGCAEKKDIKQDNPIIDEIVTEAEKEEIPNEEAITETSETAEHKNDITEPKDSLEAPQETKEEKPTCTLSVRCDTILNNMSKLSSEKKDIIPSDGIIFQKQSIVFEDGESVFDVLLRVMRDNKIHMEYESTPSLNSTYIEGIANIYEFDCGGMSGWIYKVNGKSPDCGCSDYILKDGDFVEWVYSCNLGSDI